MVAMIGAAVGVAGSNPTSSTVGLGSGPGPENVVNVWTEDQVNGRVYLDTVTDSVSIGHGNTANDGGAKLEVQEPVGSTTTLYLSQTSNPGTNQIVFGNGAQKAGISSTVQNSELVFSTGGSTERVRIDSTGKVGIGTTSPSYPLDVTGDMRFTGTLQGGSVPWTRVTSFPASCAAGQFVTAVGSTLTCATPLGGSGTASQVAFFTAGSTLSSDTNLFWDQTNHRLGIDNSAPTVPLDVTGDVKFSGTLQSGTVPWARLGSYPSPCASGTFVTAVGNALTCTAAVTGTGTTGRVPFFSASGAIGNSGVTWDNTNSRIGIGTTTPSVPLDVVGDVKFSGTLQGGSVPWGRLTNFPVSCATGFVMNGVGTGGSVSCVTGPSPTGPAGGDLTGNYPNPTLTTTGVTAGTYGSSSQAPQLTIGADGRVTSASSVSIAAPPTGSAGGSLSGTYPNPSIANSGVTAGTYGSSSQAPQITIGADGRVTSATNVAISTSPTGAAGGSLSGTYPNPGIASSGVTAGTYGSATQTAQVVVGADGRVTSANNVAIAASPAGAAGGDLAGTYPNPTLGQSTKNSLTDFDIFDSSGGKIESFDYIAYGNTIARLGNVGNIYQPQPAVYPGAATDNTNGHLPSSTTLSMGFRYMFSSSGLGVNLASTMVNLDQGNTLLKRYSKNDVTNPNAVRVAYVTDSDGLSHESTVYTAADGSIGYFLVKFTFKGDSASAGNRVADLVVTVNGVQQLSQTNIRVSNTAEMPTTINQNGNADTGYSLLAALGKIVYP